MGKLLDRLNKQLETEYKQDAEDCLKIHNKLLETTGHVWESDWRPLVNTIFKGFPSDERRFKPTSIGYIFLKGIKMAQEEIIIGNKLIAEFMGIKLRGGGRSVFDEVNLKYFKKTTYEQDGLCKFCHNHVNHGHNIKCYVLDTDKLAYHSSWDWLMPVYSKAMQETENDGGDEYFDLQNYFEDAAMNNRIDLAFSAVIEFIKWYNSNKDNNG